MSFELTGYTLIKKAISEQTLKLLAIEFEMLKDTECLRAGLPLNASPGDSQVSKSYPRYSPMCFEALLALLQNQVSLATNKNLVPSYSYGRIYYKGAILPRHYDRAACQYSLTVPIQNDGTPWDFWLQDANGNELSFALAAGDLLIYKGDKLDHWRNEFTGTKQIQAFLHYVDADGDFKDFAYDQRPMLGLWPPL